MNKKEFFSCKDMLFLPSMKGSKILAGKSGLTSPITKVNTLEMPDIINWLHGGEFLITTAFAFKEDINKLVSQIPLYKEKNVSGIAIKPKRFVEITSTLIDVCNKFNFPLIQLPPNAIFADIVKESIECILEKETRLFLHTQYVTESLIELISHNKTPQEIIRKLQKELNRKLFVINNNEIISGEDIVANHSEFLTLNSDKIKNLGIQKLSINDAIISAYICCCDNSQTTYVIALESNNPFNESNIYTINRISRILGIEIKNLQTLHDMKSKYQDNFLRVWLSNELKSKNDILLSAKSYGINLYSDGNYCAIIVEPKQSSDSISVEEIDLVTLRKRISSISDDVFVTYYKKLTIILHMRENEKSNHILFGNIKDTLSHCLQNGITLCISSQSSIDNISKAHKEAMAICLITKRCGICSDYVTYDDLGIYSILSLLPDNDNVSGFQKRFLSNLINYDKEHNTKLVETLRLYYKYNCNAKLTAKETFTHYNTILYRLDRIKEILELDIDESETKLQLQIALKLNTISNQSQD